MQTKLNNKTYTEIPMVQHCSPTQSCPPRHEAADQCRQGSFLSIQPRSNHGRWQASSSPGSYPNCHNFSLTHVDFLDPIRQSQECTAGQSSIPGLSFAKIQILNGDDARVFTNQRPPIEEGSAQYFLEIVQGRGSNIQVGPYITANLYCICLSEHQTCA